MTGKYQTMPPLASDDRDALERSIREHGIRQPIIVDDEGNIIDGHHRKEIADYLGIACPTIHEVGLSDAQKVAMSIELNVARRQLTREQKRAVIAASIKAEPEATDREHARRVGASPSTVGTVRDDLEATGEVSKLDTRRDPRGYEQPATKPSNVTEITHRKSESVTERVNTDTGEVLDESPTAAILASDDMQDRAYIRNFVKALKPAHDIAQFDPERVADLASADVIRQLDLAAGAITRFNEAVKRRRSGLRAL